MPAVLSPGNTQDWGDAADFVSFGHVAADQIDESAVYVLIAPQNVVGNTIMTPLLEMVGWTALLPPPWSCFERAGGDGSFRSTLACL